MKVKIILIIVLLLSGCAYLFFKKNPFPEKSHGEENKTSEDLIPADDWFVRQRAFPFDEIPQEEYLKSVEYVRNKMHVNESDNLPAWTSVGPANIEGRITTVAIHPSNPQIVYAGTANGGLWKSTNFCQTWSSVFDNQNTSSVGAFAIDPVNPETIYCGTGEANALRSYYPGTGMYKSTNGGASWTFIGLDSSFCIGKIAINPNNTQEVFTAASGWTRRRNEQRGIYKSTNGGINWNRKFYIADSVGAIDVVIDPNNTSKIFAAMWERTRREDYIKYGGAKSGLFLSTDSGDSWNQIGGGFPINDANLGRISLDISKSNAQIIYALTANASGTSRGLFKSTNAGVNWTNVNSSVATSSNYAWFNRICKTDPSNSNKVLCGGLDMELSSNGGSSFSVVGESHVDQHAADFSQSNPNYIVIGNDGGIDYSTDGGSSWGASTTLPISQFYAGDIDYSNPDKMLGGLQDNGTVRTTTGGTGNWQEINGGDGFYALIDYQNPLRVYSSTQNGGLARSTDGGNSFFGGTSGLDVQYTNWMTPYIMDKNNPLTMYCGTYKIFKSTNGMQSWSAISPDLANAHIRNLGTITTVDVSRSDPNVIYCGTDDANVWRTTNGGSNWIKINSGLPYRWVTRVAIHPDSANVCYVTLSGYKVDSTGSHIFRTTNFGSSWSSIKGNLPDAPINDVVIDPDNTSTLYIGTDISVMYSSNLGTSWNILATGLPSNVPCHDLTFHQPTRTLVVWTHGRSAFRTVVPLTGIQHSNENVVNSFVLSQNFPNPFNPETKINFSIATRAGHQMSDVRLIAYDALGRKIAVLVNEKFAPGNYSTSFNGENFPSGIYFYAMYLDGVAVATKSMVLLK